MNLKYGYAGRSLFLAASAPQHIAVGRSASAVLPTPIRFATPYPAPGAPSEFWSAMEAKAIPVVVSATERSIDPFLRGYIQITAMLRSGPAPRDYCVEHHEWHESSAQLEMCDKPRRHRT
ncbi:hypothetical protein BD769DRAFT_1641862 [Suillus cothurnatus]|nr:hypothetical protein BD769DRAFT_1641862 [Suillus cothurnatus]